MATNDACANCGEAMHGEFCVACGQRRFRPQDRRFAHLVAETLGTLTDLDGRLWRSLRALLFQPGRIARDWFDGRRAAWVSPIRLFLLANLVYFLLPVVSDLSLPLHNQVRGETYRSFAAQACADPAANDKCNWGGQLHSRLTEPLFLHKVARERSAAAARGEDFDPAAFEHRYNSRSADIGKMLVIVHVPFVALVLSLMAWRRHRYYAEHFVVALGLVTFVLLLMPLFKPLLWLYVLGHEAIGLPGDNVGRVFNLASLAIILGHFVLACRRCYDSGWIVAGLQGLVAFAALGATSLVVYRTLQFMLALWTM